MSKATVILGSLVVVTLVVSTWVQHDTSRRLRHEVAMLRVEVQASTLRDRAAAQEVRLADGAPATPGGSGSRADEGALREEVAALRKSAQDLAQLVRSVPATGGARSAEGMGPGSAPAHAWKNAGKSTPQFAIETALWSALGGEVDVLASTLGFTPSARVKADAWFAGLSPQVREQYGSPEKVIALMIAKDAAALSRMEVLGQRELTPDEVGVRVRVADDQGRIKDQTYLMSRGSDGWRMTLPDSSLEKFMRQLSAAK